MSDDGNKLVDLTQMWVAPQPLTGNPGNYTKPPIIKDDGHGGFVNDKNEPVDSSGFPLPKSDDDEKTPEDPPRPHMGDFDVAPGSIYEAEKTILYEAEYQIAMFEQFRDEVMKDESWVFFTSNASDLETKHEHAWPGHTGIELDRNTDRDVPGVTDPNPKRTQEIIDGQHELLKAVGSSIHLVGSLVGYLNDAGQMYAAADRASWPQTTD